MGGGESVTSTTTTEKPDWTLVWHFWYFDFERPGATIFIGFVCIVHSIFHVPHLLLYRRLGILTAFGASSACCLSLELSRCNLFQEEEILYEIWVWYSSVYVPVMLIIMCIVMTASIWAMELKLMRAIAATVAVIFYLFMFYSIIFVQAEKRKIFSTTTPTTTTTTPCPWCPTCTTPTCTTPKSTPQKKIRTVDMYKYTYSRYTYDRIFDWEYYWKRRTTTESYWMWNRTTGTFFFDWDWVSRKTRTRSRTLETDWKIWTNRTRSSTTVEKHWTSTKTRTHTDTMTFETDWETSKRTRTRSVPKTTTDNTVKSKWSASAKIKCSQTSKASVEVYWWAKDPTTETTVTTELTVKNDREKASTKKSVRMIDLLLDRLR
ncbi:cell wall protein DAN4-like [Leguminivora glycinivorella]|uniref:cell wall protein DAN4-like n=1 Tax=Leguminivora glycinivorella TaxID=1035111 RepID=UPI00200F6996|nr:cell wall protein DAN4-like [Leguminivora glycinivorella]